MLSVKETRVERARFPLIDIHTHISGSARSQAGVALAAERTFNATPEELLAVMDRKSIRSMVNLTGGYGVGIRQNVSLYDAAHPGRFYTFTEPSYERLLEPGYPQAQAQAIEEAHRNGACGLKILKTLGLYLRENITAGKLITIDDPRFDPMWDVCGNLGIPGRSISPIPSPFSGPSIASMSATRSSAIIPTGHSTVATSRATPS
jgi:hypothetical protein